ncbi:MAG TPA: sensor histidine kinase [Steroidobacteraceae bacterium]|jgi:signal transduction histidine kinase
MDQLTRRSKIVRHACTLMVLAAGLRAGYTALFANARFVGSFRGQILFAAVYVLFVFLYALTPADGASTLNRRRAWLLASQNAAGLLLACLFPDFIVTCLLVVVAWQFALLVESRVAFTVAAVEVVLLAAIPCSNNVETLVVAVTCAGFQLFAVSAAQLLRNEMAARNELLRANAELKAAYALLDESARNGERLRIARDLHDVMGHTLTTLAVHLDVAGRLASGQAKEHVECARAASSQLLEQVRTVVSRVRIQPLDLQAVLQELAARAEGLDVHVRIAPEVSISDPAQAEAVVRCVQEAITNAIRHAKAHKLAIELKRDGEGPVVITAEDDGRGGPVRMGHGLTGMRERFELLGGSLAVKSASGTGFALRATLPATGSSA